MNLRRAATIALVAVALTACSGGDDDVDELPPITDVHDLGDVTVTVHDVVVDGDRVAVDLEYVNRTDQVVDRTIEYDAFLHTAGGVEAVGVTPEVSGLTAVPKAIPPDGNARGWEVFDVPAGDSPATLLLYGEIGDDPAVVDLT
jgi:hypothetical protein